MLRVTVSVLTLGSDIGPIKIPCHLTSVVLFQAELKKKPIGTGSRNIFMSDN